MTTRNLGSSKSSDGYTPPAAKAIAANIQAAPPLATKMGAPSLSTIYVPPAAVMPKASTPVASTAPVLANLPVANNPPLGAKSTPIVSAPNNAPVSSTVKQLADLPAPPSLYLTPPSTDPGSAPPQQSAPTPYPDAPFQAPPDTASHASYNSQALPDPQAPDDSLQWHDPAPLVVASGGPNANASATSSGSGVSTPTATPSAPSVSLWTRFWTFLGFIKKPAALPAATVHGESQTLEQAAASIVRRVVNGDQNAMGLMVMIGDNARKGYPLAQHTYELLNAEIEKIPSTMAGEPSRLQPYNMGHEPSKYQPYNMGHEPSRYQPYNMGYEKDYPQIDSGWAKAVFLANGPIVHDLKVADVASSFGEERDANQFISGVMLPTHPAVSHAHQHGKVLGMARKIQAVRMPNSRISDYSATVGWELGE